MRAQAGMLGMVGHLSFPAGLIAGGSADAPDPDILSSVSCVASVCCLRSQVKTGPNRDVIKKYGFHLSHLEQASCQ